MEGAEFSKASKAPASISADFEIVRNLDRSWLQIEFEGHIYFIAALDASRLPVFGAHANHELAIHYRDRATIGVFLDRHTYQGAFARAKFPDNFFRDFHPCSILTIFQNSGAECDGC